MILNEKTVSNNKKSDIYHSEHMKKKKIVNIGLTNIGQLRYMNIAHAIYIHEHYINKQINVYYINKHMLHKCNTNSI